MARGTNRYTQFELKHSDGRRRLTPILIRPIDRMNYSSNDSDDIPVLTFETESKNRFTRVTYESPDPYKYSHKKVEDYVFDIKPKFEIKSENDIKPKIKSEILVPFGLFSDKKSENCYSIKKEIKTDIKKEETTHLIDHSYHKLTNYNTKDNSKDSLTVLKRKTDKSDEIDEEIEPIEPIDLSVDPKKRKRRLSTESSYECYFNSDEETESVQSMTSSMQFSDSEELSDFEAEAPVNDEELNFEPSTSLLSSSLTSSHSFSSTSTIVYDLNETLRKLSMAKRLDENLRTIMYKKILSNLSIKDKVRFECVCKEWQQIIREEQKILIMNLRPKNDLYFDCDTISFTEQSIMNSIGSELIRKFPNLSQVEILCPTKKYNISPIIETINDVLLKLEKVKFIGKISTDVMSRFATLFGPQLKSLDINSGDNFLTDHTLKESRLMSDNLESVSAFNRLNTLTLNRLPSLKEVIDVDIQQIDHLKLLAQVYKQQIKKISFRGEDYLNKLGKIKKTLKILSSFPNLEYLDFYFSGKHIKLKDQTYIDTAFGRIQNQCKHLKELHLFGSEHWFPLQSILTFKEELKVLGLYFDLNKGCYLNLQVLPQLKITELWLYYDIRLKNLLALIQKMPLLKTLHIKSNHCYEMQIHDLMKLESNITTFYIEDVLIDEQTLSAIIIKAKNHPTIQYRLLRQGFEPLANCSEDCFRFRREDIPSNLIVIIGRKSKLYPK